MAPPSGPRGRVASALVLGFDAITQEALLFLSVARFTLCCVCAIY